MEHEDAGQLSNFLSRVNDCVSSEGASVDDDFLQAAADFMEQYRRKALEKPAFGKIQNTAIELYNTTRKSTGKQAGRIMMLSCLMMDTKNNAAIEDTVTLIHTYRKAGNTLEVDEPMKASACYGRALQLFSNVGLRAVTDLLPGMKLETVVAGIFDVCLAQSRLLWLLHGETNRTEIMGILQQATDLLPYSGQYIELSAMFAEFGIALQKQGDHTSAVEFLNKAVSVLDMNPSKSKKDSDTWMLHLAMSYMSVDREKAASCLNLVHTNDPRSLLMQVKLHAVNKNSSKAQDAFKKLCAKEATTFDLAVQGAYELLVALPTIAGSHIVETFQLLSESFADREVDVKVKLLKQLLSSSSDDASEIAFKVAQAIVSKIHSQRVELQREFQILARTAAEMILSTDVVKGVGWYNYVIASMSDSSQKVRSMHAAAHELIENGHWAPALEMCKAVVEISLDGSPCLQTKFLLLRASIQSHADLDASKHVSPELLSKNLNDFVSSNSKADEPNTASVFVAVLIDDAKSTLERSPTKSKIVSDALLELLASLLEMAWQENNPLLQWLKPVTIIRNMIVLQEQGPTSWEQIIRVKLLLDQFAVKATELGADNVGSDDELAYLADQCYNMATTVHTFDGGTMSTNQPSRAERFTLLIDLFDLSFCIRSLTSPDTKVQLEVQQRCMLAGIHCRNILLHSSTAPPANTPPPHSSAAGAPAPAKAAELIEAVLRYRSFSTEHHCLEARCFPKLAVLEVKIRVELGDQKELQGAFDRCSSTPGVGAEEYYSIARILSAKSSTRHLAQQAFQLSLQHHMRASTIDYAACARIYREVIEGIPSSKQDILIKMKEVLQHVESHPEYASKDVEWFASVCWNQGSFLVNKEQLEKGEKFLAVALKFYQHYEYEEIEIRRDDYSKVLQAMQGTETMVS